MKNLKKVLALVLALAMTLSVMVTAGAAGYPDVAEDASYAEAVTVLSALGIIKGDENGNFNPDNTITRAEMAKILCTMVGTGEIAQRETIFTDVPSTHWASGYIAYAQQMGAVDGYGDGTFGPDDEVTYEQVIKLIMSVMGYTIKANDMGGYPTGYLMVAADKDVTANATYTSTAAAPRRIVAVLVYNALNTPIMEKVSYGTEEVYREMDGESGYAFKSLLTTKLKTYKVEGVVLSTYKQSGTKDFKEGHIVYQITNAGKINAVEKLGASATGILNNIDASATNASDLLYLASVAYVKVNSDNDKEIVCIAAKTGKNVTIDIPDASEIYEAGDASVVKAADQFAIDGTSTTGKRIFSYWNDREEDTRINVATIEDGATIIRDNEIVGNVTDSTYTNGVSNNDGTQLADVKPNIGSVKLIDTDDNGSYDLIVVKEYGIAIVNNVLADKNRINFKQGYMSSYLNKSYVVLDKEVNADLVEYSITLNGEAATVADLQENDVLYISTDDLSNPMFVEIIATRNAVEGTVDEVSNVVNGVADVYINGEAYETNKAMITMTGTPDIKLDDEGTYYLDAAGKIVAFDATSRASKNYAYLYKAGQSSMGDWSVRMFTVDGADVTADLYSKVEINGVKTTNLTTAYTDAELAEIFGLTAAQVTGLNLKPTDIISGIINENLNATLAATMTGNTDADKLVTFKLDSDNYLREIDLAINHGADDEVFGYVDNATQVEWTANLQKFKNSRDLADDAKIFMIDAASGDIADYQVKDIAGLVDGNDYSPFFYGYTEDGMSVAVMLQSTTSVDTAANLAIVYNATRAKDADDNDVYKVTYVQSGKVVETPILVEKSTYESAGLTRGVAFLYGVNDKGVVDDVEVIFAPGTSAPATLTNAINPNSSSLFVAAGANIPAEWIITGTNARGYDNEVYYGLVANVKGQKLTLTDASGIYDNGNAYVIPDDIAVTVYQPAYTSEAKILSEGTFADIMVSMKDANGNVELNPANSPDLYYCFVRLYKDEVVDVIFVDYTRD